MNLPGFNPCKGFRCFEASASNLALAASFSVSIPVRVLDVLKPRASVSFSSVRIVSIPVRVLDVLKLKDKNTAEETAKTEKREESVFSIQNFSIVRPPEEN